IDEAKITSTLNQLASRVEERLQRRELKGMTVQLMMRYADRTTVTRSRKGMSYIDDKESIMTIIRELFQEHWNHQPLRLLGITVQDLLEKSDIMEQLNLFTYEQEEKRASMVDVVQSIQNKYGEDVFIKPAKKKEKIEKLKQFKKEQKEKRDSMVDVVQSIKNKYGEDDFIKPAKQKEKKTDDQMLQTSFQKDFLDDYKQ